MSYPDYEKPSIRLVATLGGFYRVIVHGPDNLQSQDDRPRYCEVDIGRGATKEEALDEANKWFAGIEDNTPSDC